MTPSLSRRPWRSAFVVSREHDIVAVLDAHSGQSPRAIFERAAAAIGQSRAAQLRAGVGATVRGLNKFPASYQEARRALRHANAERAMVCGPDEVLLFDDLTFSSTSDMMHLIPAATKGLLSDATMRASLEALFDADLNIAIAARALTLHPNSLRYRLRRIAEITGRDPRKLSDLLELILAARLTTNDKAPCT
ncbi:MAG TPA: helix-turn-helix domain-containing protein [Streptosporangiaceae bacterium]|nr:helix-turn-helix domain-containing protein [Streptosporangiaceae bacterium]